MKDLNSNKFNYNSNRLSQIASNLRKFQPDVVKLDPSLENPSYQSECLQKARAGTILQIRKSQSEPRTTKSAAYQELGKSRNFKRLGDKIIHFFENNPDAKVTRYELSQILQLVRSSGVCQPVKDLLREGVIQRNGTKLDPQTGKNVELLELTPQDLRA